MENKNFSRVLIVDDDPQVRKILERMLGGQKCEIQTASDGEEALRKVDAFLPELVILDIMMPGMSGIEVCRNLRQKFPQKKFQILMLSAKDSQADRRLALEYGADDFVNKPFHIASLARKIQHMFGKLEEIA